MPVRTAEAEWRGTLKEGSGTVSTESGAITDQPYTFRSRFQDGQGGTNPEELIGAAHAGCFTMFFSNVIAQAGYPVTRAHTTARVHIETTDDGPVIPRIELRMEAEVPGVSEEEFQRIAEEAKAKCPVSKALRAAEITLDAQLVAS
ncbi:MAG TPA: OsmC family protein [Rubricoccaceae bacterium]|nr:OsmC family protein [Rubricoccaceae bacterium]